VVLTSDASEYGWWGHTTPQEWECGGHFNALERSDHHNIQEDEAGNRTTVAYSEATGFRGEVCPTLGVLIPKCILREQDNKTVIKVVNKRMVRSVRMCQTQKLHHDFLDYAGLQELGSFISGKIMDTERVADRGSRQTSKWPRWMLNPRVRAQIAREAGLNPTHGVDLFCEEASRQYPRIVTEKWSPHALWVDALARPWHALDNSLLKEEDWLWAFPPPALLNRIARRLTAPLARAQPMLLVVPHQPQQSWWVKLAPLMEGDPIPAGPLRNLEPPEGHHDHDRNQRPPNWQLCALRIRVG
jgi:hypothetical protein